MPHNSAFKPYAAKAAFLNKPLHTEPRVARLMKSMPLTAAR